MLSLTMWINTNAGIAVTMDIKICRSFQSPDIKQKKNHLYVILSF